MEAEFRRWKMKEHIHSTCLFNLKKIFVRVQRMEAESRRCRQIPKNIRAYLLCFFHNHAI
jgi:hypothetical protein